MKQKTTSNNTRKTKTSNWKKLIGHSMTYKKHLRQQQRQSQRQQQRQQQEQQQQEQQQQEEQRQLELQQQQQQEEEQRQLELQQQQQQQKIRRKRMLNLGLFFEKLNQLFNKKIPEFDVNPSVEDIFLLNLNHGVIPLKYDNTKKEGYPVNIIEYVSNVKQVKVLKAPIGSCPQSNEYLHHDLIAKLQAINDANLTSEEFHQTILNQISDRTLAENEDIIDTNKTDFLMKKERTEIERFIPDHADRTYQSIAIGLGEPTVNKYFLMDKTEPDGDIYLLKEAHITLPFQSTIIMYGLNEFKNLDKFPLPAYLYSAGDIIFTTTTPITISGITYSTGTEITLKMGMFIELDQHLQTHIKDMGIQSIFVDKHGNYKLYPYKTGIKLKDGRVRYERYTGILSCPYFIEYVEKMISSNKKIVGALHEFSHDIISTCTSLLYPFEHETVIAMNSLLLTNYFRNVGCIYSYDFTCQLLSLLEVPQDSRYGLDDLAEILVANNGNQKDLYAYAKGITKSKSKKKQKHTRKNNK